MKRIIIAGIVALTAAAGSAQNLYSGVNIYATGDSPPLDGFTPGTSSALQLLNDGTGGDAVSADGIYTRDITITSAPAATLNQRFQWKVASSGFSPVSYPFGTDNGYGRFIPGPMKFVFDTNPKNDGYVPDPNGGSVLGILYTVPPANVASDVVRATGAFLSELGGADWDANDNRALMNDAGTSGDLVAADGIFTTSFTGVAAGSYDFKITRNGSFNLEVNANGYATGGANLNLSVISASDVIKILFDSTKGRTKVTNSNPLANPGPPFFATSTAWSTALTTVTQMYDDGTHGDLASGNGIYSRVLNANASGSFVINVKQYVGAQYPSTGGYPIDIATTGQAVLVQFDTNTVADGYIPNTRYVWTDPSSRHVPTNVQAVGDFMSEFGGSDWNSNDPNFNLSDAGTGGDLTAGDKVFGLNFTAFAGVTGASFKAVIPPTFDYQFGGAGDGYTRGGNNPAISFTATASQIVNFQVDSVTGRIRAFVATAATAPTRPASLNAAAGAGVNDWSMY